MEEKFLNSLKTYFAAEPVDAVYLFGSQATGRTTPMSDIDIAVLFSPSAPKGKRFDLRLKYMGEAAHIFKQNDVEVVDLEVLPLAFQYQVVFPKRMLYVGNHSHMTDFEVSVVKKYLDFRPALFQIAKRHLELLGKDGFSPLTI